MGQTMSSNSTVPKTPRLRRKNKQASATPAVAQTTVPMTPDARDYRIPPPLHEKPSLLDNIDHFNAPNFLDFRKLNDSGRLTPDEYTEVTGLDDSMQWFGVDHPEQESAKTRVPKALLSPGDLQQCAVARLRLRNITNSDIVVQL
eukprot:m.125874 g.125874  ORF g.125874 m.125874 type:complete len:145 (+) comp11176_c7_seq5:84-518(+)